ncbi:histone-lysine N-methyltransferase SETMAR [Trichonephila clavipes]|nr:histone-lysine N-methyltransferase SETMAR [Trichonephila clavipes]
MQARGLKLRTVFIVYGTNTVTANCVQFSFRRFRSGILGVKDASRTGRLVFENVTKLPQVIKVDRHVSGHSIAQELKIDHKTVLNHSRKVVFKKKIKPFQIYADVWVPH